MTEMGWSAPGGNSLCPRCASPGQPVPSVTIKSLLEETRRRDVGEVSYFYCSNPTCRVTYFPDEGEGEVFLKTDLKVRVGLKENNPPRPICYCFGYSIEEIEREVARTGTSTIPSRIREKCRQGLDHCVETNPKGSCCLGDVRRVIREARKRLGFTGGGMASEEECCTGDPSESGSCGWDSDRNDERRPHEKKGGSGPDQKVFDSKHCERR